MHGRLKQLSVQIYGLAVGCSTDDFEVDRADFIYARPVARAQSGGVLSLTKRTVTHARRKRMRGYLMCDRVRMRSPAE